MKLENYAIEVINKKFETTYYGGIYRILDRYHEKVWVCVDDEDNILIISPTWEELLTRLLCIAIDYDTIISE